MGLLNQLTYVSFCRYGWRFTISSVENFTNRRYHRIDGMSFILCLVCRFVILKMNSRQSLLQIDCHLGQFTKFGKMFLQNFLIQSLRGNLFTNNRFDGLQLFDRSKSLKFRAGLFLFICYNRTFFTLWIVFYSWFSGP